MSLHDLKDKWRIEVRDEVSSARRVLQVEASTSRAATSVAKRFHMRPTEHVVAIRVVLIGGDA